MSISFAGKGKAIDQIKTRINEQIRISPVRVIAEDGAQLGIIPVDEALRRARDVQSRWKNSQRTSGCSTDQAAGSAAWG